VWDTDQQFLTKLKIELLWHPATSLLGIYPKAETGSQLLYANFHCGIIQSSPKVSIFQEFVNE
jgi:hypothetical protein